MLFSFLKQSDLFKKNIFFWFCIVLIVEFLSAFTIFRPVPNSFFTILAGLLLCALGWKRPTLGLTALTLELLIGSKGSLLQLGAWPDTTSLRIVMTAGFLIGWTIEVIETSSWKKFPSYLRGRKAYLILAFLVVYSIIRGWLMNNEALFVDANAWFDVVLLLPVVDIASRYGKELRKEIAPVLVLGPLWLALKTLGLEYFFSHGFSVSSPSVYLWIRRTGVGEVTLMGGNMFRIFMQSYIYAVAVALFGWSWWLWKEKKKTVWMLFVCSVIVLCLSLSRSLWIGLFVGVLFLGILACRDHVCSIRSFAGPITASLCATVVLALVLFFPFPHVEFGSVASVFRSRTSLTEVAAVSRWNLFPVLRDKISEHPILGSGLGAMVTYQSRDPRILAQQKGGEYKTYAFEWGWLDHWIKFGIIGIPLIFFLLVSLGTRIWKLQEPTWIRMGTVASLVALAVIHVFTPYLNHPLGFLFLFLGEGFIASTSHD